MKSLIKKIALIAFSVLALTACKEETLVSPVTESKATADSEMDGHFCKVPGAQGAFGEYMISALDGSDLQPIIVDESDLDMTEVYDGMALKFSFEYINTNVGNGEVYKKTITGIPCEDFKFVRILKITKGKHPWERFSEN